MSNQQKQLQTILYNIALKQQDVKSAGSIYDYCKSKGFNVDPSIKNR